MTALSEFQLKINEAQHAGKIAVDQLTAAWDKLFDQIQAAARARRPLCLLAGRGT